MINIYHFLPDNSLGGAPINVKRLVDITNYNHFVYYWNCSQSNSILDGIDLSRKYSRILVLICLIYKIKSYDFIFTHGRGMGVVIRFIAYLFNKKCIHTYRGYYKKRYSNLKFGKIYNYILFVYEKYMSYHSFNICVSQSEYYLLKNVYNFANTYQVYNPISCSPKIAPLKIHKRDLIFVGRRSAQKGFDKFLRMFSQNNDFTFDWFGNGEDIGISSDVISFHNGSIQPASINISKEISNSKLLICLSRWEGASTVVIESLMHQVPVISLSCQGVDEFVSATGGGYIVKEDEIISTIKNVLSCNKLYSQLQKNTKNIFDIIKLKEIELNYRKLLILCANQ